MADRVLRCPSCDGPMQVAERRGVLIDVCRECRGVFLDRGELDKLLDAAEGDAERVVHAPSRDEDEPRRDREDWSDDRDSEWDHRRGRRRRGGFLGEMFDFD